MVTTQRADQRWERRPSRLAGVPLHSCGDKRQRTRMEHCKESELKEVRQARTGEAAGLGSRSLGGRAYHVGFGAPELG